jgi:hypothetical protein
LAALPALPSTRRRLRRRRCELLVGATPAAAAGDTTQDSQENKATDTSAHADDDGFVVVDPGGHLAADRGTATASVVAFASTAAICAVEEVLLQAVALVWSEFGGAAGDDARGRVAGIGVVSLGVRAHDRFALLVTRGALAGGTLKA